MMLNLFEATFVLKDKNSDRFLDRLVTTVSREGFGKLFQKDVGLYKNYQ
jgi:hypothetical protein